MWRALSVTLLAALLLPATALALGAAANDGTLSVRNGDGFVSLNIRGAVIGKLESGVLEVEIPEVERCDELPVFGEDRQTERVKDLELVTRTVCVFSGKEVRFRLVGGQQMIRIYRGRGVGISAVGRGIVRLKGVGGPQDGQYSFNDDAYASLPDEVERFELAAAETTAG